MLQCVCEVGGGGTLNTDTVNTYLSLHSSQLSSDPGQLSQLEKTTMCEALILLSNRFNDFNRQSAFIGEIVQPVKVRSRRLCDSKVSGTGTNRWSHTVQNIHTAKSRAHFPHGHIEWDFRGMLFAFCWIVAVRVGAAAGRAVERRKTAHLRRRRSSAG